MEGLRPQINIGQIEKPALINSTSATIPEVRKAKPEAQTEVKLINLNPIDLRLLNMPEELFAAIAEKMSAKGISAEQIISTL